VAAHVPVVTGEFDQGYDCAGPPAAPSGLTTFDNTFMNWADSDGVSYLAWGWWVLDNTSTPCSSMGDPGDNYALISGYGGAAVAPDGANLHSHLAALAATTSNASAHVTTASLAPATVKVKYSATLHAAGGNRPYKWSVASGRLPTGLRLRPTGAISGKPKVAGVFTFTVKVVDHKTRSKPHTQTSGTRSLSITVG